MLFCVPGHDGHRGKAQAEQTINIIGRAGRYHAGGRVLAQDDAQKTDHLLNAGLGQLIYTIQQE